MEHASVARRAITDPRYVQDIDWTDRSLEVKETDERFVVSKWRSSGSLRHRARMPKLYPAMDLPDALKNAMEEGRKIILLHESAPLSDTFSEAISITKDEKIAVYIGPEGGFDEAEVLLASSKYGARIASLGPRRLRAETAAVVAVALVIGT